MNKPIKLFADIILEKASLYDSVMSSFSLPSEEFRQKDLQYVLAVLVSSGMNLNGGVFLSSELVSARDTMLKKPLDVEHLEGYVVGHIYDRAFMLKDRSIIDPIDFLVSKGSKVDKEDIDIAVAMALYKYRFPEIAQDVSDGKYKVSMECYYRDFDIKIGDIIISKDEASKIGITFDGNDSLVGASIKMVEGAKELGYSKIGRVFRDIMFSGCGLVEFPANEESVILESASKKIDEMVNNITIDLGKSETYMKNKAELERIEISDGFIASTQEELIVEAPVEISSSTNPGTCVNYKKYFYVYSPKDVSDYDQEHPAPIPVVPGVGDNPGLDDVITHKNWCTLFDMECSSLDADSLHPFCLRNVFNRSTKDVLSNFYDVFMYDKNISGDTWEEKLSKAKEGVLKMKALINSIKIK